MACIKPGSQLDHDRKKWEAHLIAQGVPVMQATVDAERMAVNARVNAIQKKRQQLWIDTRVLVEGKARMQAAGGSGASALMDMDERSSLRTDDTFITAQSAHRGINSIARSIQAPAIEVLERADSLDDAARAVLAGDIRRELLGLPSNNPDAKIVATAEAKMADFLKARANDAGMDVKTIADWGYPVGWDAELVAPDGNAKVWVDELVAEYQKPGVLAPLLDRNDAPLAGKELREAVEGMAENIKTGNTGGEIGRLPGAMKSRHKQPRVIRWIDQEARLRFEGKYSTNDIRALFDRHRDQYAREIGIMQVWGTNPDRNFGTLRALAAKNGASQAELQAIDSVYLAATGALDRPGSPSLARKYGTLRTFLSAALLPRAIISNVSDLAPRSLIQAGNRIPVMRSLGEFLTALPKKLTPEDLAAVSRMGVDAELGIRALIDEGVTDTARAAQWMSEKTMQWSGFRKWNQVGSILSQQGILRKLAEIRHLDFGAANVKIDGRLSRYGYDARTWDALRSQPVETYHGHEYMSVDAIMNGSLPDHEKTRIAQRLIHHVGTDGAIAMTQPGFKARALTSLGQRRGEHAGELIRNAFQFKGYSVQFVMNQVGETLRQSKGNRARYAATLFMGTTALGMVALQAKRLTKGEGLASMDPTTEEGRATWVAAMLQGGGLGILGDFAAAGFSGVNRFGQGLGETLGGPAAGFATDIARVTTGNLGQAATGEKANFGSEAVKFAGRYTPFINLPFLGIASQRLVIDQLRLMADPSGTRRSFMTMEKKQKDEWNARYWWKPGKLTPELFR